LIAGRFSRSLQAKKISTLETIARCPICGSSDFQPVFACKDHTVSQEFFDLTDCLQCGFRITNPRPAIQYIRAYYQSEAYVSHSQTKKGLINQVYHLVRQYTLANKVQLINSLNQKNPKFLLDIGCGTGAFLQTAAQKGWTVAGTEPDLNARTKAQQGSGAMVWPQVEEVTGKYSIISLWHVLEHIHELDKTLDIISKLLEQSANLLIAVPNHASYDSHIFGPYWAAYDVPRHLYHFRKTDLKKLLQKVGMEIKEIMPMPFDAYYVSLLSSKYQTGKANYLKALSTGFYSNLKAQKTGEYSSLLYICKKVAQ
jgi:2-polyprenyl-3-methyl-5-hydroxy-6-metoxy-1,4-benzoquinol methylase